MIFLYSALLFFILYFGYLTYIKIINSKFPRLIDEPNNLRKIHKKRIPTGGGIIFAFIGFIFGVVFNNKIFIIAFPLALIGFIDDMFKLSAIKRFLIQLIIGLLLLFDSSFMKIILVYLPIPNLILLIIFTLIFITGTINLTNFMDGLDGLVVGSFFIIFMYLSIFHNIQYLPFAIALLAFLVFNWPPAKLFMGDSGSTYLGATFVGISLGQENLREIAGIFLLASPLYSDSTLTLIYRLFKEKSEVFKPHKKHLYQRLYEFGFPKNIVSSFYVFAILLNSISLELFGIIGICTSTTFELMIGLYLNKKILKK